MKESDEPRTALTTGFGLHTGIEAGAGASASRWASTLGLARRPRFQTTSWLLVDHAVGDDSQIAAVALAELCERYWYPLYAWLRCTGHHREKAQDLTQGFFAQLLEKRWLADADPCKGKLRTFLLTALKRYAHGQWRQAHTQKCGGGITHVSLRYEEGEERYLHTAAENESPDRHFDRQWAINLLGRVTEQLRDEYVRSGKEQRYEILKDALQWNGDAAPYAELGQQLGLAENAVKQAVSRMRRHYRRLLTEEIRSTMQTDDPKLVEEELSDLIAAFQPRPPEIRHAPRNYFAKRYNQEATAETPGCPASPNQPARTAEPGSPRPHLSGCARGACSLPR